jgi:TolA-binding protein
MKTITKILKQSWKIIVGIVVVLLSIFTLNGIRKRKSIKKIDDKINENEKVVEKLQGKIEQVEEQKTTVKKKVVEKKKQIQKTKSSKTKKPVTRKKTTSAAKKNIISKTKKK